MSILPQALSAAKKNTGRKTSPFARRGAVTGLLFLSPWLVGLLAFTLLPMLASLALSFTNYNLIHPEETRFVGAANYANLLRDPAVRESLWLTVRFMLVAVPLALIVPLGLAALLNSRQLWGKRIFRTLFFLPSVVPFISTVYIWQGVLNSETGWINKALRVVGMAGPDWLDSTTWIYPALLIVNAWGVGNVMLTLLAGMQGVPTEYYEAARVDGAGPWTTFRHITLPLISPVIFYNLVLALIGAFQYFLLPFVLSGTNGEPGHSTFFYNLYLFKTFFTYQDMSYGATLAWVLFVVVLAVTAAVFGTAKFWVYYAAED